MKLPFSFTFEWSVKKLIQNRGIIIALYVFCLIPFVLVIFVNREKSRHFKELVEQMSSMQSHIERFLAVNKDHTIFLKKHRDVDRYYVGRMLEGTQFLTDEIGALHLVYEHLASKSSNNIKQRWDFLKDENNLVFIEENRKCKNHIEEIGFKQKHPVEINVEDLKNLLSLIEGVAIGEHQPSSSAPQFVLRQFVLRKKTLAERETFLLEMHVTKREVIK